MTLYLWFIFWVSKLYSQRILLTESKVNWKTIIVLFVLARVTFERVKRETRQDLAILETAADKVPKVDISQKIFVLLEM